MQETSWGDRFDPEPNQGSSPDRPELTVEGRPLQLNPNSPPPGTRVYYSGRFSHFGRSRGRGVVALPQLCRPRSHAIRGRRAEAGDPRVPAGFGSRPGSRAHPVGVLRLVGKRLGLHGCRGPQTLRGPQEDRKRFSSSTEKKALHTRYSERLGCLLFLTCSTFRWAPPYWGTEQCRSRGRKRRAEHARSAWQPVRRSVGAQAFFEKLTNAKRAQWYFCELSCFALFGTFFFVLSFICLLVLVFIFTDFFLAFFFGVARREDGRSWEREKHDQTILYEKN